MFFRRNSLAKAVFSIFSLTAAIAYAADHNWRAPIVNNGSIASKFWAPSDGVYFFDMAPGTNFVPHSQWDVNDMTFAGIQNSSNFQASVDPNGYGWTSVQWQGNKFSAWLNTWSINPSSNPLVNYWSIGFGGSIPGDNRAWSSYQFGANPMLCSAHFQKVNGLYTTGDIALYNFVGLFIQDVSTGRTINMVVAVWDSRPNFQFYENIDVDVQVGAFLQSYVGGSRYTTLMPWSQTAQSGSERPEEWYGFCITKANLSNIINDFNERLSRDRDDLSAMRNRLAWQDKYLESINSVPSVSLDHNNYRVTAVYLQPEAGNVRNPGAGGHVGIVMRENWVFTRY